MAVIYDYASLHPSKGDLMAAWLPSRPWAPAAPIVAGVSYRLDDPAGRVGMEGFLLTDAAGTTVHVPLTYRDAPLAGAEHHLLGTMEHSELGTRWTYDGCGDPVFVATLVATIVTGASEAAEMLVREGTDESRPPKVRVRGSGRAAVAPEVRDVSSSVEGHDRSTVGFHGGELVLVRRVGATVDGDQNLSGSWGDVADALLAGLTAPA